MAPQPSGRGLLYVNSKITSPALSPSQFTEWYQDIHIRDIFVTSGIKSAFRYFTTSPDPSSIERPYLALYPLKDVSFLQSDEFRSIPVHDDSLPVASKNIFDLADFDTRYYANVGKVEEDAGTSQEPSPFLASVQFDPPTELHGASDDKVVEWYSQQQSQTQGSSVRIRIYRCFFGRQNRNPQEQNKLDAPAGILVLHEFNTDDELSNFSPPETLRHTAPSFKLLKAFGNTAHNF